MKIAWIMIFLLVAYAIPHSFAADIAWLGPLAQGGAPDCPKKNGTRDIRSEIVSYGADEAFITGSANTHDGSCQKTSELHLKHGDKESVYPVPPKGHSYIIVDYSPDHSSLLFYTEAYLKYPNEEFRNVDVTVMSTATGDMKTWNAWDLLGWKDCDATVEPQGFTANGNPVILTRPSVMQPPRRQNCVADWRLYRLDINNGTISRLPDSTRLQRYAHVSATATQSCVTDPDIAGECFTVHGRLSFWNGSPTTRIWWIGTKHMLGVSDEIIPNSVAQHMDWGVEAYGDFHVCPLKKPKKGEMQDVCIDSAKNVIYKSSDKQ